MKCRICPDCGCNLDFGERCDCQEEDKVQSGTNKGGGENGGNSSEFLRCGQPAGVG